MKRWGALLAIAVAGCTTGITAPMDLAAPATDDLAAPADLATGCTLAFSGDVTVTVACNVFLCRPMMSPGDDLDLAGAGDNPSGAHAIFDVNGVFTPRGYAFADLRSIDVGVSAGGKTYRAQGSTAAGFGTAAITITGVTAPTGSDVCSGSAHGSATATLDEYIIDDGGMASTGAGRVTLAATF